ncbi:MAG: toll/interleukin-1 receptor domain-containing protein [Chloroflexota bacterium]|nr:toll/interleukin-1 receptor domain-containing protein [Chloroflexota bacterium]
MSSHVDSVPAGQQTVRLFYSYSHRDERLLAGLRDALALLRREGLIEEWHDRKIAAGREWAGEIDESLEAADIVLLLVSPSFIASDYCYDREMTRALERHDAGTARVIPIIVRPSDWHRSPFGKLQALPRDGKAVTTWGNRDQAWLDVANGIRSVVEELRTFTDAEPAPPVIPEGMTEADLLSLRLYSEEAIHRAEQMVTFIHQSIDGDSIYALVEPSGISRDDFIDALEFLVKEDYLNSWTMSNERMPDIRSYANHYTSSSHRIPDFSVTSKGLETYALAFVPGYARFVDSVAAEIIAHERVKGETFDTFMTSHLLARALGQPVGLVYHVLESFEREKLITLFTPNNKYGLPSYVTSVSSLLRRRVRPPGSR